MSKYGGFSGQSALTSYVFLWNNSNQVWNGSAMASYDVANWLTYKIAATELANSGRYAFVIPPTLPAAKYDFTAYAQLGGDAAAGDPVISQGFPIDWDGTDEDQGITVILKSMGLDHLISAAAASPTVGSFIDLILNKNSGQTFSQATDSLEAIRDGGSGGPTAAQIADAVVDEVLDASHVVSDSLAERLKAIDDKLPTGNLSDFDEASNNVNLGANQSGVTIGTVNNLGTNAKSHVNAEVVDVLQTDQLPEMTSGKPPTNPTFLQAIMYLFMRLRNKQTASTSEEKIYNNAGAAIAVATISDDGSTTTKEQFEAP